MLARALTPTSPLPLSPSPLWVGGPGRPDCSSELVRHPRSLDRAPAPLGLAANQRAAPRRSDYLPAGRRINAPLIKKYVPSQLKGQTSLVALEVLSHSIHPPLPYPNPPPSHPTPPHPAQPSLLSAYKEGVNEKRVTLEYPHSPKIDKVKEFASANNSAPTPELLFISFFFFVRLGEMGPRRYRGYLAAARFVRLTRGPIHLLPLLLGSKRRGANSCRDVARPQSKFPVANVNIIFWRVCGQSDRTSLIIRSARTSVSVSGGFTPPTTPAQPSL